MTQWALAVALIYTPHIQVSKKYAIFSYLGNSEIDVPRDDSDNEDALKEIKNNIKKAQKTANNKKTTEDVDDDDDDEDESGSGSDDEEQETKTKKTKKASRKEEIEKVDDSFLDLKH